jgi:ferrous iron transport protein A
VPLADVEAGRTVRLAAIDGGHALRMRLAAMGLRAGVEVTVVHRRPRGPVIVAHGSTRIGLGRGMVHRILVR